MRQLSHVLAMALVFTGLCSTARAQETEPNSACATAQEGGFVEPQTVLAGSLDAREDGGTDTDFFRLSGAPGEELTLEVGVGFGLGIFDEACVLQAVSAPDTRVRFNVPPSGHFTLAVADLLDSSFSGGGSANGGAYQVSFASPAASVGSIAGRLVDAVTGEPLRGDTQFARVELRSCDILSCSFLVARAPDALGRFRFELDAENERLPAGAFLIIATVDNYQTELMDFQVGAGEDAELGDIALSPPAIAFSDLVPCANPRPQGGVCEYSVRIRNNTHEMLRGTAHSLVINLSASSVFEASTRPNGAGVQRARVAIPGRSTRDVTFYFSVPSFLPLDTTICTDLSLGLEPSPMFNLVHQEGLFCITKNIFGLRVMNEQESQRALERMSPGTAARALPRPQP